MRQPLLPLYAILFYAKTVLVNTYPRFLPILVMYERQASETKKNSGEQSREGWRFAKQIQPTLTAGRRNIMEKGRMTHMVVRP